jgi:putative Mg2+ transporter-C (MgtC) family protein
MDWASDLQPLARVALAMGLGAVIGAEREVAHKPAGLRTHMLLAGAAAVFTEIGMAMLRQYGQGDSVSTRVDPIIIIQAVAAAVGFIGAGTILRRGGEHIEGLTTATSLLLTAAVGMAVSSGHAALGVGVTVLALVTLRGLRWIEKRIRRRGGGAPGPDAS